MGVICNYYLIVKVGMPNLNCIRIFILDKSLTLEGVYGAPSEKMLLK